MAAAVASLQHHRGQPVRLLITDRHEGPIPALLAKRAADWGCAVHMDLGRGQEHGNSCGYNSAVDVAAFLADPGEGPWWSPPGPEWEPHQTTVDSIADANGHSQNGPDEIN